jgi:UDP-N-acetyl-D-mannosaminuronic acid dehydrogenase
MNRPKKEVRNIAVVGAGIVGVPMAAMLADAGVNRNDPADYRVMVIQRDSPTSGWKVPAINSGKSPIGGIEPELDRIVAEARAAGRLAASHDYADLADADVILICVQTDKKGFGPDYGPLEDAVNRTAESLKKRKNGKIPLVIFESTLAPTSMATWVTERFGRHGFLDGRNVLLGNSPNRVMPGRLVGRIRESDKAVGGLNPLTPKLIRDVYSRIVKHGKLHLTNSLTAEIVKTLENAYRDVRIAYSAEIARACEERDLDYYRVREEVNQELDWSDHASMGSNEVPTGGLLIPTVGVGGHCLPKDGILLLWRLIESGFDMSASLILEARRINDESPAVTISLMEKPFGNLAGKTVSLMGTAYRADSEDTRNSPTLVLAGLLSKKGARVVLHDPHVKQDDQNLVKSGFADQFTRDLDRAAQEAEILVFCVAHRLYHEDMRSILKTAHRLKHVFDGCNLLSQEGISVKEISFKGFGKGRGKPPRGFLDYAYRGFRVVEKGFANEIESFIRFANEHYAPDKFNRADFRTIKAIAETCITGCRIVDPGPVKEPAAWDGFSSRLVRKAVLAGSAGKSPSEAGRQNQKNPKA